MERKDGYDKVECLRSRFHYRGGVKVTSGTWHARLLAECQVLGRWAGLLGLTTAICDPMHYQLLILHDLSPQGETQGVSACRWIRSAAHKRLGQPHISGIEPAQAVMVPPNCRDYCHTMSTASSMLLEGRRCSGSASVGAQARTVLTSPSSLDAQAKNTHRSSCRSLHTHRVSALLPARLRVDQPWTAARLSSISCPDQRYLQDQSHAQRRRQHNTTQQHSTKPCLRV